MSLREEVDRFRAWAAGYPVDGRSGEWECDYSEWGALYTQVLSFVAAVPFSAWTAEQVDDVLYAIARDNEMEYLAEEISARPDLLVALAEASVHSNERDAKWQLAVQLGNQPPSVGQAQDALLELVNDGDEYVSRRALLSLGALRAPAAVSLAQRAWETGHEYQRIAALWVIKNCEPEMLAEYIQKAHQDGRQYVVKNARELQA